MSGGSLVGFSCASDETLVVDVGSQGSAAGHQGVDSHVEFESFKEERTLEVHLNDLFTGL